MQMKKNNLLSVLFLSFLLLPHLLRGKLEKERKEKTKQLGLIKSEGSDGVEDMERERRIFQLQMCEVGGSEPVKIFNPDTFCLPELKQVSFIWVVCFTDSFFHLSSAFSVSRAVIKTFQKVQQK